MGFQLSPGVNVTEIDLTTTIPAVATSIGALAGPAAWGPVLDPVLVSSEDNMVAMFGKPNNGTANTFFTAASFLSYTNTLWFTRVINETPSAGEVASNATSGPRGMSANRVIVKNEDDFYEKLELGAFNIEDSQAIARNRELFISKYPGSLGNSITVAIADAFVEPKVDYVGGRLVASVTNMTKIIPMANLVGLTGGIRELANTMLNQMILRGSTGDMLGNDASFDSVSFTLKTDTLKLVELFKATADSAVRGALGSTFDASITSLGLYKQAGSVELISTLADLVAHIDAIAADKLANPGAESVFLYQGATRADETIAIEVSANVSTTSSSPRAFVSDTVGIFVNHAFVGALDVNDFFVVDGGNVTVTLARHGVSTNTDVYTWAASRGGELALKETYALIMGIINSDNTGAREVAQVNFIEGTQAQDILDAVSFTSEGYYYKAGVPHPVTGVLSTGWEYADLFELSPDNTPRAENVGAKWDEMHVVVIDSKGLWTGTRGAVLERFGFLSKAKDGKTEDGSNNYYVDVINRASKYVWCTGDIDVLENSMDASYVITPRNDMLEFNTNHGWGQKLTDDMGVGRDFARLRQPIKMELVGGADGYDAIGMDDYMKGYDMYASGERIDINLVMFANTNSALVDRTVSQYIIDNVVNNRKDCIALLSPAKETCVGNFTSKEEKVVNYFRDINEGINRSTSYAVADCNWKQMYDKYNDMARWVPLSGDIAGLCAFTDKERDAWWSPAGFNRGKLKNVMKLAWNPEQAQRDHLYKNGVNPVLSFPGEGPVLYGDKTLLSKPSAFDRINVRRLFIVCEKAIATASKYSLFEFNDAFTRLSFVNMVTPFLRDVQGRRGIYDFRVVCDETNNTPEVIDRNEFVGDIYIKPARSINYIQLNFVAVKTGVDFAEVIGQF
jgi:phage tail sheath protein FI